MGRRRRAPPRYKPAGTLFARLMSVQRQRPPSLTHSMRTSAATPWPGGSSMPAPAEADTARVLQAGARAAAAPAPGPRPRVATHAAGGRIPRRPAPGCHAELCARPCRLRARPRPAGRVNFGLCFARVFVSVSPMIAVRSVMHGREFALPCLFLSDCSCMMLTSSQSGTWDGVLPT